MAKTKTTDAGVQAHSHGPSHVVHRPAALAVGYTAHPEPLRRERPSRYTWSARRRWGGPPWSTTGRPHLGTHVRLVLGLKGHDPAGKRVFRTYGWSEGG